LPMFTTSESEHHDPLQSKGLLGDEQARRNATTAVEPPKKLWPGEFWDQSWGKSAWSGGTVCWPCDASLAEGLVGGFPPFRNAICVPFYGSEGT
jgi:hypothetical protein